MHKPPPPIGLFNTVGVVTLIEKEIMRFLNVWSQTLLAPIFTGFIFVQVFIVAIGHLRPQYGGIPFDVFIVPGVIMMIVIQNAFANTSSSLMSAKMQRNVFDLQVAPLREGEIIFAMLVAGVTRSGLIVVLLLGLFSFYVDLPFHHIGLMIGMLLASTVFMGALGLLGAILANKFDQMSLITNFFITPLSFLSGTFYSIDRLPAHLQAFSAVNPFFYMIDGFRYAVTGTSDVHPQLALAIIATLALLTVLLTWYVLRKGYRMKT